MRFLTRLALNIYASLGGISPILTVGNELPGASTQTKLDPAILLEKLWVNLKREDFPNAESLIDAIKTSKEAMQWEQVHSHLLGVIKNTSFQGHRRVSLLINYAVANHFLNRDGKVSEALTEAEKILKSSRSPSQRLDDRLVLAKANLSQSKIDG